MLCTFAELIYNGEGTCSKNESGMLDYVFILCLTCKLMQE